MNTILILLLILVSIIGVYITYRYMYPDKNKVMGKMYLGNGAPGEKPNVIIPMSNLDKPSSATYSFEFWLNVNKYPTTNANFSNFGDIIENNTSYNTLLIGTDDNSISFNIFDNGTMTFYNRGKKSLLNKSQNPSIILENVPLKKWIYIIVSVNNCFVDLYVDGKIVQSINLKKNIYSFFSVNCIRVPSTESNLVLGNQVDAYISGMNRYAYTMDTNTAWTSYMQKKMFMSKSDYSIHLDLFKNNKLSKKIKIYS